MERGKEMKYAVYYQNDEDIECTFFKTEEEAKANIVDLIIKCEEDSADAERNLNWDITLLKVIGECHWIEDGLTLLRKE
jgi:hypothetical protein